jgi:hypothetical protein
MKKFVVLLLIVTLFIVAIPTIASAQSLECPNCYSLNIFEYCDDAYLYTTGWIEAHHYIDWFGIKHTCNLQYKIYQTLIFCDSCSYSWTDYEVHRCIAVHQLTGCPYYQYQLICPY